MAEISNAKILKLHRHPLKSLKSGDKIYDFQTVWNVFFLNSRNHWITYWWTLTPLPYRFTFEKKNEFVNKILTGTLEFYSAKYLTQLHPPLAVHDSLQSLVVLLTCSYWKVFVFLCFHVHRYVLGKEKRKIKNFNILSSRRSRIKKQFWFTWPK